MQLAQLNWIEVKAYLPLTTCGNDVLYVQKTPLIRHSRMFLTGDKL